MRADEVYQTKEILWALLMQLKANGQSAIINRRFINRALKLGRRDCHYIISINSDTVRLTPVDSQQIERILG